MAITFRESKLDPELLLRGTYLIYGPPKVGKTTFAATFPEVLIIEAEPHGADYVSGWVAEVHSLDELRELYKELHDRLRAGNFPWKTIALDTVDAIAAWFEAEIALQFGKKTLTGPSSTFGAEYALLRAEVLNMIKQFQLFPTGLLLLAHSRSEEEKTTLNMPPKLSRALFAATNNVIFLTLDEKGSRSCYVSPSYAIEAGSRDPILNRIGRFPPSYKALQTAYLEELARLQAEGKVPKAQLASPEGMGLPQLVLVAEPVVTTTGGGETSLANEEVKDAVQSTRVPRETRSSTRRVHGEA